MGHTVLLKPKFENLFDKEVEKIKFPIKKRAKITAHLAVTIACKHQNKVTSSCFEYKKYLIK